MVDKRPRRQWSRAAQVRSEKPRRPLVPSCCPQCGSRWYWTDEDGDWTCFSCARLLVCWSRYRRELRHWLLGQAAVAEGYKRPEAA